MKWNVTPLFEVKGEEIFLLHNLAPSKFYAFLETRYEGVQKNKKLQEGAPQCAATKYILSAFTPRSGVLFIVEQYFKSKL